MRLVLLSSAAVLSSALMYDVLQKHALPPPGGCKNWSDVKEMDHLWANGAPPADAGNFCAQQPKGTGLKSVGDCNGNLTGTTQALNHGPICPRSYCISQITGNITLCSSAQGVPEQVNVQIAGPDAIVVQWVTFEEVQPANPPIVRMGTSSGSLETKVTGATHKHTTAGKRTYFMHFVRLEGLAARTKYYYTVTSGGAGAAMSDEFNFRAPYADGPTRINLYGDMGVYAWNNMDNLKQDNDRELADLVIHAGDHCYNEGDYDEVRADGYMQAFEQTVANTPWMPIVGNHEFYSGTQLSRYLDQTWEKWGPIDVAGDGEKAYGGVGGGATSATSALGAFISAGNHHAGGTTVSGSSNSVPSHTSRYFSVDFGLAHLVALSLNGYNGVDTCTAECNKAQLEWLEKDLAAVNRTRTPWVIAMSHFPLYYRATPLNTSGVPAEELLQQEREMRTPLASMPWLVADECEFPDASGWSHSKTCRPKDGWNATAADAVDAADAAVSADDTESRPYDGASPPIPARMVSDVEPLFDKYGVDVYWAGHIHFYQTFDGPVRRGKVLSNGTHNPRGVVHVCTGNGGPPSGSSCAQYCGAGGSARDFAGCQKCIETPYSYTRITMTNATDLLWEQYSNADGSLIDSWVLHQENHSAWSNDTTPIETSYTYFFEQAQPAAPAAYVKYNTSSNAVLAGYPHAYDNTSSFPGVPADLDAAVAHYSDGRSVYFFKGDQYWKYDLLASKVEPGYPFSYGASSHWPGIPAGLDAAAAHATDGSSVYFFKGARYWKYDMRTAKVLPGYEDGLDYGNSTSPWANIPHDLDAALAHWSESSYFFFKGSQVWKYDPTLARPGSKSVGGLYPGYPKPFGKGTGNFEGVPPGLSAGFSRCGVDGPPQFGATCTGK